jgi:trehalose 6-phosphate phosphatase
VATLLASAAVTVSDRVRAALEPLRAHPSDSAVLCDVDGTLAPIVPRYEDARLLDGAREVLLVLRDRMRLLGFVSGRGLADLDRMVGLDGCAYAGNHGMELRGPGETARLAPGVAEHLAAIAAFATRWPAERIAEGGLRVEPKGATITYHARGAPDPVAADLMLQAVSADARAHGLVPTGGREVVEVRPPLAVDKGTAVRALLDGSGARRAMYIGDDRTDADAWRALRAMREEGALEVAVGVAVTSAEVPADVREAADVEVAGPPGALAALELLAH